MPSPFEMSFTIRAATEEELLQKLAKFNQDVLAFFQPWPRYMHQTCKRCHRVQRFEFSLRNELWQLLPPEWHNGALCIECYAELLYEHLPDMLEFGPDDIHFAGIVSDKVFAIFVDHKIEG